MILNFRNHFIYRMVILNKARNWLCKRQNSDYSCLGMKILPVKEMEIWTSYDELIPTIRTLLSSTNISYCKYGKIKITNLYSYVLLWPLMWSSFQSSNPSYSNELSDIAFCVIHYEQMSWIETRLLDSSEIVKSYYSSKIKTQV